MIEPARSARTGPAVPSSQVRNPIDAYAKTSGARRARSAATAADRPAIPRAPRKRSSASRISGAADDLVLGKDGLNRVRGKLEKFSESLRQWEQVTVGADFPEA